MSYKITVEKERRKRQGQQNTMGVASAASFLTGLTHPRARTCNVYWPAKASDHAERRNLILSDHLRPMALVAGDDG